MCKISFIVFLMVCIFGCGGCDLAQNVLKDVGGWDLSACVDGYETCWDLYCGNRDHFDDGFIVGLEGL